MKKRIAHWYCGMCERWFSKQAQHECPLCGFDLEKGR